VIQAEAAREERAEAREKGEVERFPCRIVTLASRVDDALKVTERGFSGGRFERSGVGRCSVGSRGVTSR
jgi:hypothetical protein